MTMIGVGKGPLTFFFFFFFFDKSTSMERARSGQQRRIGNSVLHGELPDAACSLHSPRSSSSPSGGAAAAVSAASAVACMVESESGSGLPV